MTALLNLTRERHNLRCSSDAKPRKSFSFRSHNKSEMGCLKALLPPTLLFFFPRG
ncbi:hypothetical protein SK128_015890, partial [Halocaridina rubra]